MKKNIKLIIILLLIGSAGYFFIFRPLTRCSDWNIGPGKNLASCDFSGKNLTRAKLTGANLAGANLSGADLSYADLSMGVILTDANLTGANLSGADVSNANLLRSNLADANLSGANLRRANLTGDNLSGAILTDAILEQATLINANLQNANFNGANLTGADLTGVMFGNAILDHATFVSANFSWVGLVGRDFSGTDLSSADFKGAFLTRSNFEGANLTGVDFSHANLRFANFTNANLSSAVFRNADLTGANLTGATLVELILDRAILIDVQGITDRILANALGVNENELYLVTAQKQIRLETREAIRSGLEGLCNIRGRRGMAEAVVIQPHSPSTIFFIAEGMDKLALPEDIGIEPTAARFAEMVVCATRNDKVIETCNYIGGPDIIRYQDRIEIAVIETKTGRTLTEHSIEGPMPSACPYMAPVAQTSIHSDWNDFDRQLQELRNLSVTASGKTISFTDLNLGAEDGVPVRQLASPYIPVTSLAFSADGKLLAIGTNNGIIKLLQVSDFAQVCSLGEHTEFVTSLAFSPDGMFLASGSDDDTVRLWRVSDCALLKTMEGHQDNVESVAFSPDGSLLASASRDKTVRLWRVPEGARVRTLRGHTWIVYSVAFSPDGRLIAASSSSSQSPMRVWRTANGSLVQTLKAGARQFSPGWGLFASLMGKAVELRRMADQSLVCRLEGGSGNVAFSPDGGLVASESDDTTVRIWRVSDGSLVHVLEGHTDSVTSIAFSPDGLFLASGGWDGSVLLWQIGE